MMWALKIGEPTESPDQRWQLGLLQYVVGHELRVQQSPVTFARYNVTLSGNAYDDVDLSASIGSGRRAAPRARCSRS
jgi:protoporphyrinogen oxidase